MDTSQQSDFEIISVMPSKPGVDGNFLGIVRFAYKPSKHVPVVITRSVQNGEKWNRYPEYEIYGATSVQVRSSFLKTSQKGELYVQTNSLDIPWDLRVRIAEEAVKQLNG